MLDVATVLVTMFTYIDDFCKLRSVLKPGPKPEMTDSEIMTVSLFTELTGIASECGQWRFVERWLEEYFPHLIDRSRYHRRRQALLASMNEVRNHVLKEVGLAVSDTHILDSTPVPVITFTRACYTPLFPEASFGYCAARKLCYFGFKLQLVTDRQGIPIHFDLVPANVSDANMTEEILTLSSRGHIVVADKGYLSKSTAERLKECCDVELYTPKRRNQRDRESKAERRLMSSWRQIIEVVNAILKLHFKLERTLAKSLKGLVTRIMSKLTAFTFGTYLNRLFGRNTLDFTSFN